MKNIKIHGELFQVQYGLSFTDSMRGHRKSFQLVPQFAKKKKKSKVLRLSYVFTVQWRSMEKRHCRGFNICDPLCEIQIKVSKSMR